MAEQGIRRWISRRKWRRWASQIGVAWSLKGIIYWILVEVLTLMGGIAYAYYWWLCGHELVAAMLGIASSLGAGLLIFTGLARAIGDRLQPAPNGDRPLGRLNQKDETRQPQSLIIDATVDAAFESAMRALFVGAWTLGCNHTDTEMPEFIAELYSNWTARAVKANGDRATGKWKIIGMEAIIFWTDDWIDVIRYHPNGLIIKMAYETRADYENGRLQNTAWAVKEDAKS
jgi:hypothetical protein